MSNHSDPGSLQNLHPIVSPESVGWLPLASGWKVLAVIMVLAMAWLAWRTWRHWRDNAYRRAALREFEAIDANKQSIDRLPALLKRTALAAYPREVVAGLSGTAWHRFLDRDLPQRPFSTGCGTALDALSYGDMPKEARNDLLTASRHWLKHHQPRRDAA